jgi:hypothetical protein
VNISATEATADEAVWVQGHAVVPVLAGDLIELVNLSDATITILDPVDTDGPTATLIGRGAGQAFP